MSKNVQLLDVVALLKDLPEHGLWRGQVSTAVEPLAPDAYVIEFSDDKGCTYAMVALPADQRMVLHYQPIGTACGRLVPPRMF